MIDVEIPSDCNIKNRIDLTTGEDGEIPRPEQGNGDVVEMQGISGAVVINSRSQDHPQRSLFRRAQS